jgi:hypothetical protein
MSKWDRCAELDTHTIVLATLYKLKATTKDKLQIAVYLFMRKMGYECIDYSKYQ